MSAAFMLRLSLTLPTQDLEPLETWLWERGALALDVSPPVESWQEMAILFPDSHGDKVKEDVAVWLSHLGAAEAKAVWETVDTGDWRKLRREASSSHKLGQFWLIPHSDPLPDEIQEEDKVIRTYANHAFGTGDHVTTGLLLRALQHQNLEGCQTLDMGCGTGILAIAAEKMGAEKSHGFDNDSDCREDMDHHLALNHTSKTELWIGDISSVSDGCYDWIWANVTLNVHREFLPELKVWCHPKAQLLGSGVTLAQWDELVEAYGNHGWVLTQLLVEEPWVCFHGYRA